MHLAEGQAPACTSPATEGEASRLALQVVQQAMAAFGQQRAAYPAAVAPGYAPQQPVTPIQQQPPQHQALYAAPPAQGYAPMADALYAAIEPPPCPGSVQSQASSAGLPYIAQPLMRGPIPLLPNAQGSPAATQPFGHHHIAMVNLEPAPGSAATPSWAPPTTLPPRASVNAVCESPPACHHSASCTASARQC